MHIEVAEDFVRSRFAKAQDVESVLLVGSSAVGYQDGSSDVDLEIVVPEDAYRRKKVFEEFESYRGLDVSWEWLTFQELKDRLKNWENDVNLWIYSKSRILFDRRDRLNTMLSKYKGYPERVWRDKLFLYWYYATGNAPYDSGKAIRRGDLINAQLYMTQAAEYYTSLIFILNRSFVPYRKWRLKEMEKLEYKPDGYVETLRAILSASSWTKHEFEKKQEVINALVRELERKLLSAGVTEKEVKDPWRFKVHDMPRI